MQQITCNSIADNYHRETPIQKCKQLTAANTAAADCAPIVDRMRLLFLLMVDALLQFGFVGVLLDELLLLVLFLHLHVVRNVLFTRVHRFGDAAAGGAIIDVHGRRALQMHNGTVGRIVG